MALEKLKITVLYDGTDEAPKPTVPIDTKQDPRSMEMHEQVADALTKRGHHVTLLRAEKKVRALSLQLEKDQSDIIFNLCESLGGENQHEQHVAALLELLRKPFTGSTALALTLAHDKGLAKKLFSFHELPYPRFEIVESGQLTGIQEFAYPLYVRPVNRSKSPEDNKDALVRSQEELSQRIATLQGHAPRSSLFVEEYAEGRELFVGILGTDRPIPLPILEWNFSKISTALSRAATPEAKWDEESEAYKAPEFFPTDLPPSVSKIIQEASITAFRALQLSGYGCVEIKLRKALSEKSSPGAHLIDGWEFFILKVNPNPSLDKRSELATAARKQGYKYPQLIEYIIEQTIACYRRKRR